MNSYQPPRHRGYFDLTACFCSLIIMMSVRAGCDIQVNGSNLTVTTRQVQAVFQGPDLVRLTNRLTGEQYVRARPNTPSLLEMKLLEPTGKPLIWTAWRTGDALRGNPDAAMITLNDLVRSVWLSVVIEPETGDIVLTLWGESAKDGVTGLQWGLRGLDLSAGRLVLPASGGRYADRATAPQSLTLDYPTQWEAQMVLWEGKDGGFVVYSRDDRCLFKKLHLSRRGDYADIAFETEAVAPWPKAMGVPQLEWRINAFRGDWRVPASGYKNLMRFLRPPVNPTGARAWVKQIRTVTTIHGSTFEPALLDALARKLDPKKTLLYLPSWRRDGYDVNYPDYTPHETLRPFVERAHALGFRVMLHTDLPGVTPTHPDFARVRRYQVKDARTLAPMGWYWDHPESDPNRFAYINPAAKVYRDLFIERLKPLVDDIQPDALHLDISGPMFNDGNGLIENKNYAQGSVALHRALLTAFPNVALGGESMNELISPYNAFAQRWNYGSLPPHPISDYLFGDQVLSYGYLGQPNPDQSPAGFLSYFSLYEGQGVYPTPVLSSESDLNEDRTGMQRLLRQVRAWQEHEFVPDWEGDWKGMLFRWRGGNGATATVSTSGGGVRLQIGEETLYQRVRGQNRVVTTQHIPGWPAYDENTLLGLDPNYEYWLEPLPRPQDLPHISALSQDVMLTGSNITPAYALFSLAPIEKPSADLVKRLPEARTGTTINGDDGPLAKGAAVELQEMQVGGDTRRAIFAHPPYQNAPGGETFIEYVVSVPETPRPALVFACGINDLAGPTDGVTFRITADGKEVWRQHVEKGAWRSGRVDLSAWTGRNVGIRLITNPGPKNDASFDHVGWSDLRILSEAQAPNASATVRFPSGVVPTGFGGGTPSVSEGTAVFSGLSLPAQVVAYFKPGTPLASGASLLDMPHETAILSSGVASPGTVYGSGSIGEATCGGVKKARTLNAHTPNLGQTVFSWLVKLPDSDKPTLGFYAGLGDGANTTGVGYAIRVNGENVWTWATRECKWNDGTVDLSRWKGQTVLLQLVTDSNGDNVCDWARWADVAVR